MRVAHMLLLAAMTLLGWSPVSTAREVVPSRLMAAEIRDGKLPLPLYVATSVAAPDGATIADRLELARSANPALAAFLRGEVTQVSGRDALGGHVISCEGQQYFVWARHGDMTRATCAAIRRVTAVAAARRERAPAATVQVAARPARPAAAPVIAELPLPPPVMPPAPPEHDIVTAPAPLPQVVTAETAAPVATLPRAAPVVSVTTAATAQGETPPSSEVTALMAQVAELKREVEALRATPAVVPPPVQVPVEDQKLRDQINELYRMSGALSEVLGQRTANEETLRDLIRKQTERLDTREDRANYRVGIIVAGVVVAALIVLGAVWFGVSKLGVQVRSMRQVRDQFLSLEQSFVDKRAELEGLLLRSEVERRCLAEARAELEKVRSEVPEAIAVMEERVTLVGGQLAKLLFQAEAATRHLTQVSEPADPEMNPTAPPPGDRRGLPGFLAGLQEAIRDGNADTGMTTAAA